MEVLVFVVLGVASGQRVACNRWVLQAFCSCSCDNLEVVVVVALQAYCYVAVLPVGISVSCVQWIAQAQ